MLSDKVKKLEKIVKKQDELLKLKEVVVKNKCKKSTQESEKETFPKLMMKSEYKNKNSNDDTIINFKPIAFHLIRDSIIYDAVDGKQIDKWEKKHLFYIRC
jgi:hypothetical protein